MTLTDWNNFLRAYRAKHPELTYKQAQKLAANEYRVRGVYGTGKKHSCMKNTTAVESIHIPVAPVAPSQPQRPRPPVNPIAVEMDDLIVPGRRPSNSLESRSSSRRFSESSSDASNVNSRSEAVVGSGDMRPELIYYPEIHGTGYAEFKHKPDWYKPARVSRPDVQGSGAIFSRNNRVVPAQESAIRHVARNRAIQEARDQYYRDLNTVSLEVDPSTLATPRFGARIRNTGHNQNGSSFFGVEVHRFHPTEDISMQTSFHRITFQEEEILAFHRRNSGSLNSQTQTEQDVEGSGQCFSTGTQVKPVKPSNITKKPRRKQKYVVPSEKAVSWDKLTQQQKDKLVNLKEGDVFG